MNIIVTGASRGLGFEMASIFAQNRDNKVIAIARGKEGLHRLKDSSGGDLNIFPFDLVTGDFHGTLVPQILSVIKNIDILVNNAGLLGNKPFADLDDDDFDLMFGANVKSAFRLTRSLLPYFSENAHIVNIGSMGGYQGSVKFPGLSLYSASKGALAILTECLAEELKEKKIAVNCLALGSAQTEMLSQAFPGYKAPLTAAEMAGFIADFACNGHRYFNGKILPVSVTTP
ncbi:MAG: SDR family oxidoreductase [Bacteroidales bacterium]